MGNTLNNITEKKKIIFVDGIPERRYTNSDMTNKENIIVNISSEYPNAVFFTDDSNLSTAEIENDLNTNNQEYFNIYKNGKRYTKFQDVVKGNYISIGHHKIYLKNRNGFLYLQQGKDILSLDIIKIMQNHAEEASKNEINILKTENNLYYDPESVIINSKDNQFKVKYDIQFRTNEDPDDGSGDNSLEFGFYTKDEANNYKLNLDYLDYITTGSDPENNIYNFKCKKPILENNIYIKATSEYDADIFCYYPIKIYINIEDILFRNFDTGEIIRRDINLKVNNSMNISYEYKPEEANKVALTIDNVTENSEYFTIANNDENERKFTLTALKETKHTPLGYRSFSVNIGRTNTIFNVYISKDKIYYWYIGLTNPTEMTDWESHIQTNIYTEGFHTIDPDKVYTKEYPLLDAEYNQIMFNTIDPSTNESKGPQYYYVLIPKDLPNNDLKVRHEIYGLEATAYTFGNTDQGDNSNVYEIINSDFEYEEVHYVLYKSIILSDNFAGKIF